MLVEKLIQNYEITPKSSAASMSKDGSSSKNGNHNLTSSGPLFKSVNTAPDAENVAVSGDLYLFTNRQGKKQIWQREEKEDVLTKIRFHDIKDDGKVYVQLSAAKVWTKVQEAKPVNVESETRDDDKEQQTLNKEVQELINTKNKLEAEIYELKNKKRKANEYDHELQLQNNDNNKKKKKPNNIGSNSTQVNKSAQTTTGNFTKTDVIDQHSMRKRRKQRWTQQDQERLWILYTRFKNDSDKWGKLAENFSSRSMEAIRKRIVLIKSEITLWSDEDKRLLWKTYTNLTHDANKWGKLRKTFVGRTKNAMIRQISILRQQNVANREESESSSEEESENSSSDEDENEIQKSSCARWDVSDKQLLWQLYEKVENDDDKWGKIATMFPGRSEVALQVQIGILRRQSKEEEQCESSSEEESENSSSDEEENEIEKSSRAKWNAQDKQLLWQLYKKFEKDDDKWGKIATTFPGRSELALQVQIANIIKTSSGAKWDVQDKQLLWQLYKKFENDDDKWGKIVTSFPGRSELALQVQIGHLRRQKKAPHKKSNANTVLYLRRQKKASQKQNIPNKNQHIGHGDHKIRETNDVDQNIQSTASIHGVPFIKGKLTYHPIANKSILTAEWAWDQKQLESNQIYAKNTCSYVGKGDKPKSMIGSFNMYTEVDTLFADSVAATKEYRNLTYEEQFDNLTYVIDSSSRNSKSNNYQIKITGNGFNNFGKFEINGTLNKIPNQNDDGTQEWQIVLHKQYKAVQLDQEMQNKRKKKMKKKNVENKKEDKSSNNIAIYSRKSTRAPRSTVFTIGPRGLQARTSTSHSVCVDTNNKKENVVDNNSASYVKTAQAKTAMTSSVESRVGGSNRNTNSILTSTMQFLAKQ